MIHHAALRWPQVTEGSLWPMAMHQEVHLHNQIPSMETGMAPVEIWSKSKSSYSALKNAHTWVCPVFVLDPKLQDGQKIPKWKPRSRMGQYMGRSSAHSNTVGLIRNIKTGRVSPQFHVIYDDLFETAHSSEETQPLLWHDLEPFNSFKSDLDEEEGGMDLQDEWLNEEDLKEKVKRQRLVAERTHQSVGTKPQSRINDRSCDKRVRWDEDVQQREHTRDETSGGFTPWKSSRNKFKQERLTYDELGGNDGKLLAKKMVTKLGKNPGFYEYLMGLLMNSDHGIMDNLPEDVLVRGLGMMSGFKSGAYDPDTPTMSQAMRGEHREDFMEAMKEEIQELEKHRTW